MYIYAVTAQIGNAICFAAIYCVSWFGPLSGLVAAPAASGVGISVGCGADAHMQHGPSTLTTLSGARARPVFLLSQSVSHYVLFGPIE